MTIPIGLFQAYGIELEYMIVHRESLAVLPVSDRLLQNVAGELVSDFEDGDITWSNELVLHVLEFKTTDPTPTLKGLASRFQTSIERANRALSSLSAMLMPTAMHPLMNPFMETRIWPHDNNEVYSAYNRIFDCRGHGWSNLQSMHINLPFQDDEEFFRLHTAIRFLLPILPALTASSPIVEGLVNGVKDNRLLFYQQNQRAVPSIAGQVIPEPVTSMQDYQNTILGTIYSDIAAHDPEDILRDDWLNSRGAIARFGRQTIEIRVLDTQESPTADLALADLITAVLKRLANEDSSSLERLLSFSTGELKSIFDEAAQRGEASTLANEAYLKALDVGEAPMKLKDVWLELLARLEPAEFMSPESSSIARQILESGSLATRITRALGSDPSPAKVRSIYRELARCLEQGLLFNATYTLETMLEQQKELRHPNL